jgi:hypothetical protein
MNVTPAHENKGDEVHQEGVADPKAILTIIVSTGLLGLLVAGAVDVRQTAMTGLRVAEQHGQELLMIRGEISQLRQDMLDRTVSRYTAEEQEQFARYLESRLHQLEEEQDRLQRHIDRCCKNE